MNKQQIERMSLFFDTENELSDIIPALREAADNYVRLFCASKDDYAKEMLSDDYFLIISLLELFTDLKAKELPAKN